MVTRPIYQPERGDLIWLDFTPHAGTEQAGTRPALVLSPQNFNIATGLILACPVTNKGKGSPFEVALPRGTGVTGYVLADQMRSLDWIARNAAFKARTTPELLWEVLGRIEAILRLDLS